MTYKNFTVETDADGIALVTWDMPDKSMNVFTEEVMVELNAITDAVTADAAVKGVVFTSGKSSFSGGADLSMIKGMFSFYQAEQAHNPEGAAKALFDLVGQMSGLFRRIETSGKPWVSAINGTCWLTHAKYVPNVAMAKHGCVFQAYSTTAKLHKAVINP